MPGVLGAASIPFIACVTLLMAMILQVLSFAAPFWAYDNNGDFGLWRKYLCLAANGGSPNNDLGCYKQDHPWYIGDWLDAVRAMESLAIIFWAIPLVIIPVYIYVALGLYYRCLLGTMTALTLLGAICNLIGFLVYAAQIAKNDTWFAGWCFILCIIADAFGFLSFVILVIATCKKPEFTLDQYYTSGYFIHPERDELYIIGNMEPVKDASIYNGGHVNPVLVAE
ncbi:unnamed protein product [Candidula unifasciata]|uniref:Uncharacterized protein n=1 Tax=Candidula unifasciata TaxID=100452 RepID=A0A8S4A0N8_9EUPU|nr:unnamed protein product [Candidula unifasciata]